MFLMKIAARNIERQKVKSILGMIIGMVIVMLLNIYVSNMESIRKQLLRLPDALPISAKVSCLDGLMDAGITIKREYMEGVERSPYVKDPIFTVQLVMSTDEVNLEHYHGELNLFTSATNSIKGISGLQENEIEWLDGEGQDFFTTDQKVCVMDAEIMEGKGLKLGDIVDLTAFYYRYPIDGSHEIFLDPLNRDTYKIVGVMDMFEYTGSVIRPGVLLPLQPVMDAFDESGQTFSLDSLSFMVKDPFKLNELKAEMKEIGFLSVIPTAEFMYDGNALTIRDSTFIKAAERLEESRTLLVTAFPFVAAIVVLLGYITAYLLIQSRQGEYAIMRSLGMKHSACFETMLCENAFLQLLGCGVGSLLSAIFFDSQPYVMGSVALIFLLCFLTGTAIALRSLGKISVMRALSFVS